MAGLAIRRYTVHVFYNKQKPQQRQQQQYQTNGSFTIRHKHDVLIISKQNWIKNGKPTLATSQHNSRDASANKNNIVIGFNYTVCIHYETKS